MLLASTEFRNLLIESKTLIAFAIVGGLLVLLSCDPRLLHGYHFIAKANILCLNTPASSSWYARRLRMQVSIYLTDKIVRKVDRVAKRTGRSRSRVIESLLESSLQIPSPQQGGWSVLMGAWKDDRSAKDLIAEIYKSRKQNRRSNRSVF